MCKKIIKRTELLADYQRAIQALWDEITILQDNTKRVKNGSKPNGLCKAEEKPDVVDPRLCGQH